MKTVIIFLLCGCMLSANQLFAQKQKSKLLPVVTITAEGNISQKVRTAFAHRFKDAENLRWFSDNQHVLVKFIMNDHENHASFRTNGDFVYHIGYGEEKHLPSNVKDMILARYAKYNIGRVFNVNRFERSLWIVNLESEKNYIIARIENDAVNEITRYKNATARPSVALNNAQ